MNQDKNKKVSNGLRAETKPVRILMVILKGVLLFLFINVLFSFLDTGALGRYSLYNHIFPGRVRLPFGENPTEAFNFSLSNLDAMIASHEISGKPKGDNEFRVILIGDSSTWGTLLKPEATLTGLINARAVRCNGKSVRAFNLGYPTLSLTKDLLILEQVMQFKPDLIIWPVTLEAFPLEKQLSSPIVAENMNRIIELSKILPDNVNQLIPLADKKNDLFENSIIGQRRQLADLLRLQLYGSMWAATGIDQVYPLNFEHAQIDLADDLTFHGWTKPEELKRNLALEVLDSGKVLAGDVPIMIINEPILISSGENSDIRYDFYYPRWAFDQYRQMMVDHSNNKSWQYLDLWNSVPASEFTNSAIHLTPDGEMVYANRVIDEIKSSYCK